MTDRHAAYLVLLDRDIREDDAEAGPAVLLRQIKGVASVVAVTAEPAQMALGAMRRDVEWRRALGDFLRSGPPGGLG